VQVPASLSQSARSRELEQRLLATIVSAGPIPLARFMEQSLYDPDLGYYTAGPLPWGADADYVTAPQVHPALGQSVAALAVELDDALGHPDPFALIEIGSGNGQLARAVLATIERDEPSLWGRLSFTSVERGAAARAAQADLPVPGAGVSVKPVVPSPGEPLRGLVYANELLDAFPVHRIKQTSRGLLEAYVDVAAERLVERYLAPSTSALGQYLADNSIELADGQVGEICLQVEPWLERLDGVLAAGGVLADFGNLQRVGERLGMFWAGRCSLRVFLIGMGATAAQEREPLEARMALRHLLVSEIADAHSVAFLCKGLPGAAPVFGRARLDASA